MRGIKRKGLGGDRTWSRVRRLKRNGVGRIRRNWMRETHEEERSWKKE